MTDNGNPHYNGETELDRNDIRVIAVRLYSPREAPSTKPSGGVLRGFADLMLGPWRVEGTVIVELAPSATHRESRLVVRMPGRFSGGKFYPTITLTREELAYLSEIVIEAFYAEADKAAGVVSEEEMQHLASLPADDDALAN